MSWIPKFNRQPLDLAKLWNAVRRNGGSNKVCQMKNWAQIGRIFGGTTADKNVSNNIKRAFSKWLLPYEEVVFPDEAMASSNDNRPAMGTTATLALRKRDRQRSHHQMTTEKKLRTDHSQQYEEEDLTTQQESVTSSENTRTGQAMRPTGAFSCNPSITLPPQRSYVSIPHSTESKFCIILLPSSNTEDMNSGNLLGSCVPVDNTTPNEVCGAASLTQKTVFSQETLEIEDQKESEESVEYEDKSSPLRVDIDDKRASYYRNKNPQLSYKKNSGGTLSMNQSGMVRKDLISDGNCIGSEVREHSISSVSIGVNGGCTHPKSVNNGDPISGVYCYVDNNSEVDKEGGIDRKFRNPFKTSAKHA